MLFIVWGLAFVVYRLLIGVWGLAFVYRLSFIVCCLGFGVWPLRGIFDF